MCRRAYKYIHSHKHIDIICLCFAVTSTSRTTTTTTTITLSSKKMCNIETIMMRVYTRAKSKSNLMCVSECVRVKQCRHNHRAKVSSHLLSHQTREKKNDVMDVVISKMNEKRTKKSSRDGEGVGELKK